MKVRQEKNITMDITMEELQKWSFRGKTSEITSTNGSIFLKTVINSKAA